MSYAHHQSKTPNMDKLFIYLQKSQWHNVSANFSGFVRKEFDSIMEKLDEEETNFTTLRRMIEFSEMGRFTEAKDNIDQAYKEYQVILNELRELQLAKNSPRRQYDKLSPRHDEGRTMFSPKEGRTVYSPGKRGPQSPDRQRNYTPDRPRNYTPQERNASPRRYHEVAERSPRSPVKIHDDARNDPNKDHYDSLRLKSPEKPHDSQRYGTPQSNRLKSPDKPSREGTPRQRPLDNPNSSRDRLEHESKQTKRPDSHGRSPVVDQFASSKELWGRDHGDKDTDKVANSTYRQSYHQYPMESVERKDRERYRENFGSLAERTNWVRAMDDAPWAEDGRRNNRATPELDINRPSELAKKFRTIYNNEWRDAYDEICADLGSEKTVRHLLWIVTEASLIASDVAERQLRDLEKQAFDVMTAPGPETRGVRIPPRNLGESLPVSRTLLIKYRKQTAQLSVPYVRQECRDKICRTLLESGVPKQFLNDASRLVVYIHKCAEIVWLMCIQDPPITMEYINKDTEGARFNQEHYSAYTSMGPTYDYGVWPLLRHRGEIISKGIAQGI